MGNGFPTAALFLNSTDAIEGLVIRKNCCPLHGADEARIALLDLFVSHVPMFLRSCTGLDQFPIYGFSYRRHTAP